MSALHILLFRPVIIIFTLISQYIVYYALKRHFVSTWPKHLKTSRWLFVFMLIINFPLLLLQSAPDFFKSTAARHLIMVPYFAYQTLSIAIVAFVSIYWIGKMLVYPFRRLKKHPTNSSIMRINSSRRLFIKKTAIIAGAYTFVGSAYSIYNRDEYEVNKVIISIPNLPGGLHGLTISMISDIHSGLFMTKEDVDIYVAEINKLKSDVIFIPGDFITSKTEEIFQVAKSLRDLRAPYGIYACLGNHDFFGNPVEITKKLTDVGIRVLRNETTEILINGSHLILSGVDDGIHANFKKVTLESSEAHGPRILLCHKPYYFEKAVAGDYDLMMSGHTHGGQIVFARVFGYPVAPASLISKYISGLYRLGRSTMYVSRGIGTVGLPLRVNCPPEITLFKLT